MSNATGLGAGRVLAVVAALSVALVGAWTLFSEADPAGAASASPVEVAAEQAPVELVGIDPPATERREVAAETAQPAEPAIISPVAFTPADTTGTVRIWGSVRPARGGAPLEVLSVTCRDAFGSSRNQRVDARSRYSFDGLAPGRYWLTAQSDSAALARANVDAREDMRVDFELEAPRFVRIRVLDEAGVSWVPPEVDAIVTRSPPGAWTAYPVASPLSSRVRNGSDWQPGELQPVQIEWPDPNFVSLVRNQLVVESRRVEARDTEVVFLVPRDDPRMAPGSVRFRLVDAKTGEPVTAANVQLNGAGTVMPQCREGEATVTLPPGPWTLHVMGASFGHSQWSFRIEPGVALDLGDLTLGDGVTIRGRVVDESGAGLAVGIDSKPCDERGLAVHPNLNRFLGSSAADGAFEMRGVSRGFHSLRAFGIRLSRDAPEFPADTTGNMVVVDTRNGDVDGVVLRFVPGVALMICPSGRETNESSYRVVTVDGVVVESGRVSRDGPARVVVAPGGYDVEMWHEQNGPRSRVTIHADGDPVRIDMP